MHCSVHVVPLITDQSAFNFLRSILMKCKAKDRRSVDFFCEVDSITGQGVMRIYVESSVRKPNFFKKQNFEKSEGAKWF
jgi:hypothetical protein